MRIRQAKLGFNSQWENSFLRNVNLIRDSTEELMLLNCGFGEDS